MATIDTAAIAFQLKRVYPKRQKPQDLYKKDARKIVLEAKQMRKKFA